MAKKDEVKAKAIGSGKSRMKVFVAGFEMEGNDEVMAEGFKAIRELSTAISRNAVLPPSKPALAAGNTGSTSNGKVATLEAETDEQEETASIEETVVEDEGEEVSSGNGSGTKRSYNFKTPTFLNELDLSKGTKPLPEFIAAKSPTDVMDKYLVVAFWLQKHMGIEEVTVDHIYTVFDHLDWKGEMPVKPGKPLSDLKSKRHVLTREPDAAGYKVNFKGERYIENMGAQK